jgi:CheY-like chemotaxis protein
MPNKRRVLILDDEFEVRKILSAYLTSKKGGYEVAQAATIDEAMSMATRQPFDHILSDVFLGPEDEPDVETGLDFLRKAKAAGIESNI